LKNFVLLTLAVCFVAACASSAFALRWPSNLSYRVESMGGISFGVEDETTALTTFNHQNVAGFMLNKKTNRIDVGLGYSSNYNKSESTASFTNPFTGEVTTTVTTSETEAGGIDLSGTGAEYRGLTYWLEDNMAFRAGIEALTYNAKMTNTTATTDNSGTTTNTGDDAFGASGLGAGGAFGYKTDTGLALGAGLSFKSAGGKPDALDDAFNVYGNNASGNPQTTSLEAAASNFDWAIGAAMELPEVGGQDNKLTLGLHVHGDDDMPDFGAIINGSTNPATFGDYSAQIKSEGTIEAAGNVVYTDTSTYTISPMVISLEAIFNAGSMIEAGLLFDYKMSGMNTKEEQTGRVTNVNVDYKNADISVVGITPVVQAKFPAAEGIDILAGLTLSTWGSGTTTNYALNPLTPDVNDTYKNDVDEFSSTLLALGGGIQALGNQLQAGIQLEFGGVQIEDTNYDTNGAIALQNYQGNMVSSAVTQIGVTNFRIGGEYWAMPMLAIRAGFAILGSTQIDGYYNSASLRFEDLTTTTGRFTLGVGLSMPQGMAFDLLIRLDSTGVSPVTPNTEEADSATAILVGAKLPI
jgi:hypothetical protein